MSFPSNVSLPYISSSGSHQTYDLGHQLADKRVVFTSAVEAFSPVCSHQHVPTYLRSVDRFRAKGVDRIVVVTANDPSINHAWAQSLGYADPDDYVIFAQDPELALSSQLGDNYTTNLLGLGVRPNRYAALVDNGDIQYLGAEDNGDASPISAADSLLSRL